MLFRDMFLVLVNEVQEFHDTLKRPLYIHIRTECVLNVKNNLGPDLQIERCIPGCYGQLTPLPDYVHLYARSDE